MFSATIISNGHWMNYHNLRAASSFSINNGMKFPRTYWIVYYSEWDTFKLLNNHAAPFYTNNVYAKCLFAICTCLLNKPSDKHLSMASVTCPLNTGYFACIFENKFSPWKGGRFIAFEVRSLKIFLHLFGPLPQSWYKMWLSKAQYKFFFSTQRHLKVIELNYIWWGPV